MEHQQHHHSSSSSSSSPVTTESNDQSSSTITNVSKNPSPPCVRRIHAKRSKQQQRASDPHLHGDVNENHDEEKLTQKGVDVGGGGGRERLKRHREEVAGRVLIPDTWGQEGLLKDWIDSSVFEALVVPNHIASARKALVADHHHARKSSSSSSSSSSTSSRAHHQQLMQIC